jgi:hypothetical protein
MDGSAFDAWTRRRFGLAAGGVAASLLALAYSPGAQAKKKRKKRKRCRQLRAACSPGSKKKCCKAFRCLPTTFMGSDFRCCKDLDAPCGADDECCTSNCSLLFGCIPQE